MATSPFNLARPDTVATPFLSNNGNPNTVYNTAATPIQNFGSQPLIPAAGGILPQPWGSTPVFSPGSAGPVLAAQLQPGSAFATPDAQFWRNFSGAQRPVFDLSTSGVTDPNTAWTPLLPEAPPTSKPSTTKPPATPGVRPDTRPQDEVDTGRYALGGNLNISGFGQNGTATVRGTNGNTFSTRPAESVANGLRDLASNAAQGMGFNGRDGQFDVNQFLDAVTQVFLPGDLYNANVGSWNGLNVATSLMNSVVPGLGRVATWLIDQLPQGNALRSWMQRNIIQNNVDDALNRNNYLDFPQGDRSGGGGLGGFGTGLEGRTGGGGGGGINVGTVTVRPPQHA